MGVRPVHVFYAGAARRTDFGKRSSAPKPPTVPTRGVQRLPALRVALHLVFADGRSSLPRAAIPDLVDEYGRFIDTVIGEGFRFFFLPRLPRSLP